MANWFVHIHSWFIRHRSFGFALMAALFLLTGWGASRIRAEEDISKMLPRDRQTGKLNDILQSARFADRLVLMLSMTDSTRISPDTLSAYAEKFSAAMQSQYPEYIRTVQDAVSDSLLPRWMEIIQKNLPLFLDSSDYMTIDSLRQPDRIPRTLAADLRTLASPAGAVLKPFIAHDPVGISNLAYQKIRQLQYDENFELYNGHIVTHDNRYLLLFLSSAFPLDNTGKNGLLLKGIDSLRLAFQRRPEFQGVGLQYFGAIAVSEGNAVQLRRDSYLTLGITVIFLVLFIGWYFKRKRAPVIILLPVLLGALFSLSLVALIQGHISVIALAGGSVVLGIAINYSLHVYNHYRHLGDMNQVLRDLAFPLTVGGLTTIGGFFGLRFAESDILRDLGLFAAFSLIGASLASLIFLPLLITVSERKVPAVVSRETWIERLSHRSPERSKWLVAVIFLLTIGFLFTMNRVRFDQDLTQLNYMPAPLKAAEATLNRINAVSLRSLYLVTDGKSLDEALRKQERVQVDIDTLIIRGVINKSSGAFRFLLSDSLQQVRLRRWNAYWEETKVSRLLASMVKSGDSLGFNPAVLSRYSEVLNRHYELADSGDNSFIRTALAEAYILEKKDQQSLVTLLRVQPEHRQLVYDHFAGDTKVTVVDRTYLANRLVRMVQADFGRIGWITSVMVFVVLLLTYGRFELALVSFIPMLIAFIWILGIMGLFGLQFNLVNVILSALIFGLGDDYSLFIMGGLLQEYKTGKQNLSSYKSSIVLSAITTLAGLGVLVFAKHPAMRSIALVSIAGILSVVLVAQVLIPFFFRLLISKRVAKKRFPWTVDGFFKSVFSLSYFATGSWIVTALGYVLVKWNPFDKEKGKELYHRILSSYTWSVIYIMGNVKKKKIDPLHENFQPPVVMIANHQSFLDILIVTLLYPKVVLLTNEWVWRSPVFGKLVRIADYVPAFTGIESNLDQLRDQVAHGYSVVVFPEGTRTPDGNMKRFHKGAFFLADALKLDILPLVIHGTAYTMSKNDFLLKDGSITMKFLPRIRYGDKRFGETVTEQTRAIGRYFRKEYASLKRQEEQPAFFRHQLIANYIYKGPVLEWYMRIKTTLEHNYQWFHDNLPLQGRIIDIGCGYGFMSYMLHWAAPGRDITGIDYDEEKIAVASHCFSRDESIRFVVSDASDYELLPSDAIVLADVLHYLKPEEQSGLLLKCMRNLLPGGKIIVRDGDKDLKKRHGGTKLSEFFSTQLFGFNKTGSEGLHFLSGDTLRRQAEANQMNCVTIDQGKFTSNMLFVITHKSSDVPA